ncbi:uncharacterized protein LJ206_014491 [Theristicus caerulescens]
MHPNASPQGRTCILDGGTGGPETQTGPQAVAGVLGTAAFFLCEELLGQHFDMVPDGVAKPQLGDLFLFPLASGGPGWWGAHAAVYCGDGEIIHLEGSSGTSPSGIVAKHGKSHLLRTRGPAKVLQRKGGLDAAALQHRIRAAMDQAVEYDAVTCNCVHFALTLLGLGHLAGAMVGATTPGDPNARSGQASPQPIFSPRCPQRCSDGGSDVHGRRAGLEHSSPGHQRFAGGFGIPLVCCSCRRPWWRCQQPSSVTSSVPEKTGLGRLQSSSGSQQSSSSSPRAYETLTFLLFKSVPGHGEVFEEVSESTLQHGDILLFPTTIRPSLDISFKHAAVYCGDGEVIHFQNTDFRTNRGRIIKDGFEAMKKERGKFRIYRKKGGIDLNDFRSKVRKAMNSEADYDLRKNNCIHFALCLLDLVEFYMQLVKIQNEGGSCSGGARTCHIV